MLVLSRFIGEELLLIVDGIPPIRISVADVRSGHKGPKVRLGIDAASHVAVHRKEVYEAIQRELGEQKPPTLGVNERREWD